MEQLFSSCLRGHGVEHEGCLSSQSWGQRCSEGCECRGGCTVPCPWDLSPGRSQLTAPEATRGFRGSELSCWLMDSLESSIFERDLSWCEAALTPSGAGAGSPAKEPPWEQLKGLV